ncbi:carboxypeptidase-like regulatory domain-containing protein [Chitinophaga pendula]|uniref:carboxypeptidase-like regulatory domain-containing protein n=1 Tax=Chitinophaga TaxID=79328 RepID=UPI000BB086D5|nr:MULTISPECIES: carboxypeptidase-like regulatory domain-containing protein [Chitinophaga]ASZ11628.1 hypothetical protein CK934_11985 [Chitinophaga sp. MD30]UCJ05361.1 carboxypeptidase-like regulatory domain-containing protein [Chitinophaga pendula]
MLRIFVAVICILCLLTGSCLAQSSLKGLVLSEDSIPLAGVSILNKENKSSAVTDDAGTYNLRVQKGDTLLIRAIGYTPVLYLVADRRATPRHYLKRQPLELNTINIRQYNFFKDSIAFRNEFRKNFEFRRKKWYEVYGILSLNLNNLQKVMQFKNNRKQLHFKKILLQKEQDNFIDRYYSPDLVTQLTNLHGDSLTQFMQRYRPSYDFIRNATQYDMGEFIKKSYISFVQQASSH